MKKIIAILAILMLVPFTAFGLEALSEDVLDDVTGQAGVSIAADVMMNITMDTLAWGDSDGIDNSTSGQNVEGWVGLKNLNITDLRIRLNTALVPTPGAIRLFTIDVATDPTVGGKGTYVHMLLGSQHITMASMTANVQLGATHDLGSELGSIAMYGFDMVLNGDSYVDISAHGTAGVTLDFDVTVESITIVSCAWGDNDGLGVDPILGPDPANPTDGLLQGADTTVAGYIGLSNVAITNMTVVGRVMIDVATLDMGKISGAGAAAGLIGVYASMLAAGYDGGTTGVLIRLDNIAFGMETFEADVVLAANGELTANASTLGSIWMDNLDVTVNGWVGIFAH
jgi:hypothetical protein